MTIGDLVATMRLDISGFKSGASGAQGILSKMSGSVSQLGGVFGGLGGQIAAFAGVTGFGFMTSQAMELVDSTGELADSLGMTTESLIGLRHAAAMGGGSADILDSSLKKMMTNLSDAKDGAGGAAEMLNRLRLNAAQLATSSPDAAFLQIAESISKLPNAADQANAALKIFGKTGTDLLPMLQGGAAGIQGMMTEAENLGMTFSSIEPQGVAAANDAIDRMRGSVGSLFNSVAIGVAPMAEQLANGFASIIPAVRDSFGWVSAFVMDSITVVGWSIANIGPLSELAFKSATLSVVGFGNDLIHQATVQWPATFGWFCDNFTEMIQTAGSFVGSIFTNMGSNIASIMKGIWDFIASGGTKSLSIAWTPLLTGFENTVSQIPIVAPRELSELEKTLMADTKRLGETLGDSLGETMLSSWEQTSQMATGGQQLATAMGMASTVDQATSKSSSKGSSNSGPVAAREGTSEAYRLIRSAGSQQQDSIDELARKKAEQQLAETKKQTALLQQLVNNTGEPASKVEEIDIKGF